ncbi:hypothetical protein NDU88_008413 [Pleurodeles waltl]|uniref:Uncharacterized protein n=1 Tax=Pleurodeles waltl TaxID=8319 RepID=A0AAV7RS99_PLEWA|nr:hypothetical protein NDU88_008413 [Pleurodeles waltl]
MTNPGPRTSPQATTRAVAGKRASASPQPGKQTAAPTMARVASPTRAAEARGMTSWPGADLCGMEWRSLE